MGKKHAPPPSLPNQSKEVVEPRRDGDASSADGTDDGADGVETLSNVAMHFDVVSFDADDIDEASHLLSRCLPPGADVHAVGAAMAEGHALLVQEGEIDASDSDADASMENGGDIDDPATFDYVGVCGVVPKDRLPSEVVEAWGMLKTHRGTALWVMDHTPSLPWHVTFPLAAAALQPWVGRVKGGPTHLIAVARALPVSGVNSAARGGRKRRREEKGGLAATEGPMLTVTEAKDSVMYRGLMYVFDRSVDIVLFRSRCEDAGVEVVPLGDIAVFDAGIRGDPIGVMFSVEWSSLHNIIETLQTVPEIKVES